MDLQLHSLLHQWIYKWMYPMQDSKIPTSLGSSITNSQRKKQVHHKGQQEKKGFHFFHEEKLHCYNEEQRLKETHQVAHLIIEVSRGRKEKFNYKIWWNKWGYNEWQARKPKEWTNGNCEVLKSFEVGDDDLNFKSNGNDNLFLKIMPLRMKLTLLHQNKKLEDWNLQRVKKCNLI